MGRSRELVLASVVFSLSFFPFGSLLPIVIEFLTIMTSAFPKLRLSCRPTFTLTFQLLLLESTLTFNPSTVDFIPLPLNFKSNSFKYADAITSSSDKVSLSYFKVFLR